MLDHVSPWWCDFVQPPRKSFCRFFDGLFPFPIFFCARTVTGSAFMRWRQSVSFDSDFATVRVFLFSFIFSILLYMIEKPSGNIFNSSDVVNCFPDQNKIRCKKTMRCVRRVMLRILKLLFFPFIASPELMNRYKSQLFLSIQLVYLLIKSDFRGGCAHYKKRTRKCFDIINHRERNEEKKRSPRTGTSLLYKPTKKSGGRRNGRSWYPCDM